MRHQMTPIWSAAFELLPLASNATKNALKVGDCSEAGQKLKNCVIPPFHPVLVMTSGGEISDPLVYLAYC